MRIYSLEDGAVLVDLGRESALVKFPRELAFLHPDLKTKLEEGSFGLLIPCGGYVTSSTASKRPIYYVNPGASHMLYITRGQGDNKWNAYAQYISQLEDSFLYEKGLSLAVATSVKGGCWMEFHCYPTELYSLDTYSMPGSDGPILFPSRPKLGTLISATLTKN